MDVLRGFCAPERSERGKARWYDPLLGRFNQADNIIPEAKQGIQAWDRFTYVNNNPISYYDSSGHCIDPDTCLPKAPTTVSQVVPLPPTKSGDLDSDVFGRAILGRYLSGGGDWNITYDKDWTDYMSANPTLTEDLGQRAEENAKYMYNHGYSAIFIDETYPMEIENGEAIIGYQYLHGTNQTVGGFHRFGSAEMTQTANGDYEVKFNMVYRWNDNIDPNPQYTTDKIKSFIAEMITLGRANPYEIHISWTKTFVIRLDSKGYRVQ